MSLPQRIGAPSPLNPLLLLPLPPSLPSDPVPLAASLADELHALVNAGLTDPAALNALAAGMRHVTRSAQLSLNAGRARSTQARAELDDADAALRATMYELGKVRDAAAECEAYVPEYTRIELEHASHQEFLAVNAEIGASLPSDPLESDHLLTLARLESELSTVLAKESQLAAMTKERDSLVRARREVRAKFDAVDVWLADYAKTTNAMGSKIRDVTKVTNPPRAWNEEAVQNGKEVREGKEGKEGKEGGEGKESK